MMDETGVDEDMERFILPLQDPSSSEEEEDEEEELEMPPMTQNTESAIHSLLGQHTTVFVEIDFQKLKSKVLWHNQLIEFREYVQRSIHSSAQSPRTRKRVPNLSPRISCFPCHQTRNGPVLRIQVLMCQSSGLRWYRHKRA
jgi:hypothetical protein